MHRLATYMLTVSMLVKTHKRKGVIGVSELVESPVSPLFKEVYGGYGLVIGGKISFFKLADAKVIDGDATVYFTTTHKAVDSLLEDLKEAEDLGGKK